MTRLSLFVIAAALTTAPIPLYAADRAQIADRVEDRIDRREDRIDRVESRRDRRGIEGARVVDRHERRSWRRIWRPGRQD
ncbi:hypothetical protein C8N43_1266 [Litoreibacter ponti]|uniref:Secreted protein n=1 Tax=Litoreibacter ponti TaxID=1510457 RepID=A0A2T6BKN3_9RHOB|nr:hypothetical protein [Litoreibacter ponti]PTX56606.1 hypothetical protein C8N43_1266 [Litoreibacter ponti]